MNSDQHGTNQINPSNQNEMSNWKPLYTSLLMGSGWRWQSRQDTTVKSFWFGLGQACSSQKTVDLAPRHVTSNKPASDRPTVVNQGSSKRKERKMRLILLQLCDKKSLNKYRAVEFKFESNSEMYMIERF